MENREERLIPRRNYEKEVRDMETDPLVFLPAFLSGNSHLRDKRVGC
jgi:hypothetical protein